MARSFRPVQPCEDCGRIGHLGHCLGADEAAGLHPLDARFFQSRNEFKLLLDGQIGGIILQPIAWADFHNINTSCHDAYVVCIEVK